jgi:hypothetical protein
MLSGKERDRRCVIYRLQDRGAVRCAHNSALARGHFHEVLWAEGPKGQTPKNTDLRQPRN